jgi:predicted DNA-binding transcriptional regulator YafY
MAFFVFAVATTDLATAQPATSSDVSSLCRFVENTTTLMLKYDGDPEGAQMRVIHLHAVGYTRSNDVLLFGLQVGGYSEPGKSNKGWLNFRADRISSLSVLDQPFRPANRKYPSDISYVCKASPSTLSAPKAKSKTISKTNQVTSIEQAELCDAARNNFVVEARFNDDPRDQPVRIIVPHAVGPNKHGQVMVFAFQIAGYSPGPADGTPTIPGWRTFRLDNLTEIKITDRKYAEVKSDLLKSKFITEPLCTAE